MKNYSILFLGAAVITALIGFTGLQFKGVEVVRILCLLFTDLFVVSLIAKTFFPKQKLWNFIPVKSKRRKI